MAKYSQQGGVNIPYIGTHLGGTTIAPNGTATTLTLPTATTSVYFRAESQAAYYQMGGSASASSYGFVPSGGNDMIFGVDNLGGSISVYTGTGGTVHIQYYEAI